MTNDKRETVLTVAGEYRNIIPPYRLSGMIATAAKIVDMMVRSYPGTSYDDCLIILDIVRDSIATVRNQEKGDGVFYPQGDKN